MDKAFDIGFIVLTIVGLVSASVFHLWNWRGRFLPARHSGMRLEEHRHQAWRSIKWALPSAGLMVVLAAQRALELWPLSRVQHTFWSGFLTASLLFVTARLVYGAFVNARRLQAERRLKNQDQA